MDLVERAGVLAIQDAVRAAAAAAAEEASRWAVELIGIGPPPGTDEWEAEQKTNVPAERALASQLLTLRVELAVGLDGLNSVVALRSAGVAWSVIGRATSMSRQSAQQRWGVRTAAVLDQVDAGPRPDRG